MSEGILSTLITVGGMLATFLFSQWLNSRSQAEQSKERRCERRDDYREWYRRTLFEKRLTAVQEAYAWLMKLYRAFQNPDASNLQSEANDVLTKTATEAGEWFNGNTIFLHDEVPERSPFVGLLSSCGLYANGMTPLYNTKDELGVLHHYLEAKTWIQERARKLLELESEHECNGQ